MLLCPAGSGHPKGEAGCTCFVVSREVLPFVLLVCCPQGKGKNKGSKWSFHLGSSRKALMKGKKQPGIKVALLEQHFHVGFCLPMAGWEVDVAVGEMTTLHRIVRLVSKQAAGFGGFSLTAQEVTP